MGMNKRVIDCTRDDDGVRQELSDWAHGRTRQPSSREMVIAMGNMAHEVEALRNTVEDLLAVNLGLVERLGGKAPAKVGK